MVYGEGTLLRQWRREWVDLPASSVACRKTQSGERSGAIERRSRPDDWFAFAPRRHSPRAYDRTHASPAARRGCKEARGRGPRSDDARAADCRARRLRAGIRAHRDSTGHALCWHHPALWGLLPRRPIHCRRFQRGRSFSGAACGTAISGRAAAGCAPLRRAVSAVTVGRRAADAEGRRPSRLERTGGLAACSPRLLTSRGLRRPSGTARGTTLVAAVLDDSEVLVAVDTTVPPR